MTWQKTATLMQRSETCCYYGHKWDKADDTY